MITLSTFPKTSGRWSERQSSADGQQGHDCLERLGYLSLTEAFSGEDRSVLLADDRQPKADGQVRLIALIIFQIRRHLARWQRTVLLAED